VEANYEVDADTMMITAFIGVIFNLIVGGMLHFFAGVGVHHIHSHSHSHSHHTPSVEDSGSLSSSITSDGSSKGKTGGKKVVETANLNIRAAFVHVLGDLVQSLGVFLAAVLIKFTGFELADPICTFLFGLLVLMTTIPVLRDATIVLMESCPSHVDTAKVLGDLAAIPGVSDVHSLRVWSLKLDSTAASVHLEIRPHEEDTELGASESEIVSEAHHRLHTNHNIEFITIQVECRTAKTSTHSGVVGEESVDGDGEKCEV